MGGKSTYIRSVALNILLAHVGCYVCSESAQISMFDSIIVRVGAEDNLGSGLSTFMTEMKEVAWMLKVSVFLNNLW